MSRYISIYSIIFCSLFFFAFTVYAGPTSTNYELEQYGFGAGGTSGSTSPNFQLMGIGGEMTASGLSSPNFQVMPGLNFTIQAHVPPAPIFTNPSSYYNKLHIVISTGNNASDATYAVAISSDNFVSDTRYVQSDNTVSTLLGAEDWRTYEGIGSWVGATGTTIIGLSPSTTYTVKVAAEKGNFTQTGFGPTDNASTIGSTLTFDLDVSAIDTETAAPYTVNLGSVSPGTVVTSTERVWVDISTNATSGGSVYVNGANNGLLSTAASHTINSVTNDLSSILSGYGARSYSVSQGVGGPMRAISPYNGVSNNVGILDTDKRLMFDSTDLPVTSGRVAFELKVKAGATTLASNDYTDTLTVVVAGGF